MDKTVAKQTWAVLAKAIDEIYNRNASLLSFEELYRNAYNLVLHKHGTLLYEGVTEKLYSHLTETAKNLSNVPNTSLLEELSSTWVEHQVRPQQMESRQERGTVTAAQIDGHSISGVLVVPSLFLILLPPLPSRIVFSQRACILFHPVPESNPSTER